MFFIKTKIRPLKGRKKRRLQMSIIPYKKNNFFLDPFTELDKIQKELHRLFNFSFTNKPYEESVNLYSQEIPNIDISDAENSLQIKADLPGLKKEEIDISIENNLLTIKGEKNIQTEKKEKNYYKKERVQRSFFRTIELPVEIDNSKINAKYENGVLELNLPKKEEAKQKRLKIDIQ